MFYKYILLKSGIVFPLLAAWLTACNGKPKTEASAAAPEANRLPVDILVAREQALDREETFVGTLVPYREVVVVSELSQKITGIQFKDGSYVNGGSVLYTLRDTDIKSRLRQVRAELDLARLNKDRMDNLLKTEAAKQQEHDEALMRLNTLEAQQEYLQTELDKTVIRAPFSGKIGISKVHPGAYVSPGMSLVTLQDQRRIKINFSLPERYLPFITEGTAVTFSTELSDERHRAHIIATEPGLDVGGRSLEVQALVENRGKFRPGQSARVYFNTGGEGSTGIRIPAEALVPGENGYNAFVIKNAVAKPVAVAIDYRTETEAIIRSGITAGDSVIVSNMLRISDGTPVTAVVSR